MLNKKCTIFNVYNKDYSNLISYTDYNYATTNKFLTTDLNDDIINKKNDSI